MAADFELNAIEETAAAWLVERDRGFARGRERAFRQWMQADARHAAAFEALASTWDLLGETQQAVALPARITPPWLRRWLAPTLAAAAAVTFAYLGWEQRMAPAPAGEAVTSYVQAAATEVGEIRQLALPDGSTIQLNTDSAVEIQYVANERRVRLARGEAHFQVAKDAARPFVVRAAEVDVRVVGTVFNVRLRPAAIDVLVTEGKVRVAAAAEPAQATNGTPADATVSELMAGQKLSIPLGESTSVAPEPVIAATAAEIRQTLAWQTRRLDFDATPLGEIVTEINRYNRHQLVVADPRLNARRFGGSFPATDYETFVRMLETDFAVVAERRGNETWLRLKAP
jgi:transmembrane sensor